MLCIQLVVFMQVYNVTAPEGAIPGGIARFAAKVKQFAPLNPLLLFSGDALSPSNSECLCGHSLVFTASHFPPTVIACVKRNSETNICGECNVVIKYHLLASAGQP